MHLCPITLHVTVMTLSDITWQAANIASKKRQLNKEYYQQFGYEPQINPVSQVWENRYHDFARTFVLQFLTKSTIYIYIYVAITICIALSDIGHVVFPAIGSRQLGGSSASKISHARKLPVGRGQG